MSRIRGSNTKPELMLRAALAKTGVRYRVNNRRVPGTPDISHRGKRVAIFVDGCFWHGCPTHYKRPKSRLEFWDGKLAYNRDLRQRVLQRLTGWHVVQVWECRVRTDADGVASAIAPLLL